MRHPLAAIDLGTNSFHMLVARPVGEGRFQILDRVNEVVRLGRSSFDIKRISTAAMARGLDVMERFKSLADAHNARVIAIATSAVREAKNGQEFVSRVLERTGIQVEVITGAEEARLIYLGVLQAVPVYNRLVLVLDIGGGSTEFLVGQAGKVLYANSIKVGAIRLTERFFPGGIVEPGALTNCRESLIGELMPVFTALDGHHVEAVVGSSGTVKNIFGVAVKTGEGNGKLLNNHTLTSGEIRQAVELLAGRTGLKERAALPGLGADRVDIIVGGALILEAVVNRYPNLPVTYSDYALREGILYNSCNLLADGAIRTLEHVRLSSISAFQTKWDHDRAHSRFVGDLALQLYDALQPLHGLDHQQREYLQGAALLHDIGLNLSLSKHHMHSYYLVRNAELMGFTDREIEIIACVARYHRKSHPKQEHVGYKTLTAKDQLVVRQLAAILRVADGLDRRHLQSVSGIQIHYDDKEIRIMIQIDSSEKEPIELWGAQRKAGLMEEVLHRKVVFLKGQPGEN